MYMPLSRASLTLCRSHMFGTSICITTVPTWNKLW